ncbi:hypothetical protein ATCC90586_007854 [Pythium insidiosum]|nr:hypothetical protein ATCC90586_007854 [Pythium insidiosum]
MHPTGTQQEYTTRFLYLLSQLPPLPEFIKRWLYQQNLRSETSAFVSQNIPQTLSEVIELAQRFEDARRNQPTQQGNTQGKGKAKLAKVEGDKKPEGHGAKSTSDRWCPFCSVATHNTADCRKKKAADAAAMGAKRDAAPKNGGHRRLYADYFATSPVYPPDLFRRRFRVSRQLFDRLLHGIVHADDYFEQRPDATGKLGLLAHQKVTAAVRVLCYGLAADAVDDFTANGNEYSSCYLLCDGIYPSWSVFMKTISHPSCQKTKLFAKKQESVRKDVERCFGVLQARFDIVNTPGRFWSVDVLRSIWKACVVMHNMIIEDDELTGTSDDIRDEAAPAQSTARSPMAFDQFLTQLGPIQDETKDAALQSDLVEHMWTEKQKRNLFDE